MAPSDFPGLFKSIMCSFRSMLSSLDLPIVVLVAESNGCIKRALLKWAQRSHLPWSIIITQRKLRGHATEEIWLTQRSVVTKINHQWCCVYIFDPADLVRRPLIYELLYQTSKLYLFHSFHHIKMRVVEIIGTKEWLELHVINTCMDNIEHYCILNYVFMKVTKFYRAWEPTSSSS